MSDRVIDWEAIRKSYEAGGVSLGALGREFGVSRQAIKKRAVNNQWVSPVTGELVTGTVTPPVKVTSKPTKHVIPNRNVEAGVRAAKAIEYRQSGWTYQRIADECGYADPSSARHAVQRELDRVIVQNVEDWRADHVARLEKLHEELWTLATDTKNKGRLFAVDRLLAIADREAKLLGLDKKTDSDEKQADVIVQEVPPGFLGGVHEHHT